jgi:acetoacetate decarboxylase
MSSIGVYDEYIHQVEVRFKGEEYNYNLTLILNNESAIFAGREKFGLPKNFGNVSFKMEMGTSLFS